MKRISMSRRRLMFAAAALTSLPIAWIAWKTPTSWRRTIAETLLHDLAGARAIGIRYLADAPEERDAAFLTRELFDGIGGVPRTAPQRAAARRVIAARRARDFATGDTVLIDGWILARSEARLCALAALS